MDPEQIRELEESIRRINEMLSQQTTLQAGLLKNMKDQLTAINKDTTATNTSSDAKKREAETSQTVTKLNEAEAQAKTRQAAAAKDFTGAMESGKASIQAFASALLSTERGFTKYGAAVSSMADATQAVAKEYGLLGELFGKVVQVGGKLLQMQLQQLDAQLTFKDQLSKMGQVGTGTTAELTNLAKQAGYSYQDLHRLTKPLQTAAGAMSVMTDSTNSGAKTFLQMANIGDKQTARFEKMGYMIEDVNQIQAEYINLQKMSGAAFRNQAKDVNTLRKNSLAYAENLIELTRLTGKSAETLIEQEREAKATFNERLLRRKEDAQIRMLQKQAADLKGTNPQLAAQKEAEAKAILREQKMRDEFQTQVSRTINGAVARDLSLLLQQGRFSEQTAYLQRMGFTVENTRKMMMAGGENMGYSVLQQVNTGADKAVLQYGNALQQLGEQAQATKLILGEQPQRLLADTEGTAGMTAAEIKAKAEPATKPVLDEATDTRSELNKVERDAKRAADDLLTSLNMTTDVVGVVSDGMNLMLQGLQKAPDALNKFESALKSATDFLNFINPAGEGGVAAKAKTVAASVLPSWASGLLGLDAAGKSGSTGSPASDTGKGGFFSGAAAAASSLWRRTFGGGEEVPTAQSSGGSETGRGSAPSSDKKILDFIGKIESGNNYNKLVGGKVKPDLTNMTVAQIQEFQKRMLAMGHESTAVGKYQIVRKTLAGLVKAGAVGLNDVFDPATQDKAAIALMNGRGRLKFLAGKMDIETYANNLAQEWSSLPMSNGKSAHEGVGSNKSLTSRAEFINILKARNGGVFNGPASGYPIEMHGTELVAPLQKNSVLMELANTPLRGASRVDAASALMSIIEKNSSLNTTTVNPITTSPGSTDKMLLMNAEMIQMLSNKLDTVIETLAEGNETSTKLLRRSSV